MRPPLTAAAAGVARRHPQRNGRTHETRTCSDDDGSGSIRTGRGNTDRYGNSERQKVSSVQRLPEPQQKHQGDTDNQGSSRSGRENRMRFLSQSRSQGSSRQVRIGGPPPFFLRGLHELYQKPPKRNKAPLNKARKARAQSSGKT